MSLSVKELEATMRERLENEGGWTLSESQVSGRGIFATRDFRPGQVILVDIPLVKGPRAGLEVPICVECLEPRRLRQCGEGCRLPVCGEDCQRRHGASPECALLRGLGVGPADSWCPELYRALTPIRCLSLSPGQRSLVSQLQANPSRGLSLEVKLLKRSIKKELPKDVEEWMDYCCRVLDSVAFEAVVSNVSSRQSSIRGLYPLAGMMNHSCCPNTRNFTDKDQRIVFVSSRSISKGEELFTSYCPTLWATHLRSQFLQKTKQFVCSCPRCSDPTEFGTYLSGLGCSECGGIIMPVDACSPNSSWVCDKCGKKLSSAQATFVTALLAQTGQKAGFTLPPFNHISLEASFLNIIKTSTQVKEMKNEELQQREHNIKFILEVLNRLQLGECRTRGLLYYELYSTGTEMEKRKESYTKSSQEVKCYLRTCFECRALSLWLNYRLKHPLRKQPSPELFGTLLQARRLPVL